MKTKRGALILLLVIFIGIPGISLLLNMLDVTFFSRNLSLLILTPLIVVFGIWALLQSVYFVILSLFGYGRAKRDYPIIADKTRFLIFIPAHNEATVIASTIKNLAKMTYATNLYQIVVINDNSTDQTGEIARQYDVDVVDTKEKRFNVGGVGKPRALEYTFLSYQEQLKNFDLILVLDADNQVDPNILTELNSQYIAKGKPEAIQTYLDSKNYDTLLSLGYAASYWTMNRFFQLAKYRMGLPNSIGGTGFAVSTQWLIQNKAFTSTSLTEDLEMEIRIVEGGGRVLWNHFARIYDEKPTSLKSSMIQRYRWSKGHWYVAFTHAPRLMKGFIKTRQFRYIDQLAYLFSMRQNFQILLALMLGMTWFLQVIFSVADVQGKLFDLFQSYFVPASFFNYFFLLYGFVLTVVGFLRDAYTRKTPWMILKTLIALFYFSFTYIYSQMWGLFNFRAQNSWSKTEHKIEVKRQGKQKKLK